jgi:hypothetical protein
VGCLTSCATGPVEVSSPDLSGADAQACRDLVEALPDSVAGQDRREVSPDDGATAAWGDPAIELRCGVPEPAGFDEFATCQVTNDVGWFIPQQQIDRGPGEIVMTTVGRAQNVEVRLPADYWPPAAAMVDLADAVRSSTREVEPCV